MRYCKFVHDFNCRCMKYHNYKTTGEMLMSGEFKHHMNILTHNPNGLNREWYQIDDLDEWLDSDLEKGSTLIKHHKSIEVPNFRNNGKYGR